MTHLLYITPVYISMLVRSLRSDPLEKDPGNVTEVRAGDVLSVQFGPSPMKGWYNHDLLVGR